MDKELDDRIQQLFKQLKEQDERIKHLEERVQEFEESMVLLEEGDFIVGELDPDLMEDPFELPPIYNKKEEDKN